ncbi:hypothetical protein D9619_011867 [Psilocybe cf. subviscida]|uniref:Glycosyltransferase family 1 protein n=1 Tax=Psilocybe cf. subviscida TaxID=2480587 RepID=A0A8H5B0Y9_9AGAR|nr:hypothetical protein D9619_011867 [Psilocybe cf. subviscida]
MSAPLNVLVFTYPEAGQATTILSLVDGLLAQPQPTDIHVASFSELEKRVEKLNDGVNPGSSLTFHTITGVTEMDAIWRTGMPHDGNQHPPLTRSNYAYEIIPLLLCPWTDKEFEETVQSCKGVLLTLKPDVILMDMVFHQAIEACKQVGAKYIVNTCMPPLGMTLDAQPNGRAFWYYPCGGSGIPFPVPWSFIPKNIWLTLRWAHCFLTDARAKKATGFQFRKDIPYICQGLEELEYPMVVPPNMTLYGPILAQPAPLTSADELRRWIGAKETVLFMMGTHYDFTDELARIALEGILNGFAGRDMQILWKLPNVSKFEKLIQTVLKKRNFAQDTVRAASWLDAPITSILSHPNLVCFIHHGGANSYFESAYCGVPQVILPQWFDLYDNARRVEYLGIGECGNMSTAPRLNIEELENAVSKVTTESRYRRKAAEIGQLCRRKEGRANAVNFLIEQGTQRFSAFI